MLLFSAVSEPGEILDGTVQRKVFQCVAVISLSLVSVQMLHFSTASEPGNVLSETVQWKVSQ